MILADYAREVATELRNAYNSKSPSAVDFAFRKADRALSEKHIEETSRRSFWATVRGHLAGPGLLVEKQANSSLLALMRAIQQELAAREKK